MTAGVPSSASDASPTQGASGGRTRFAVLMTIAVVSAVIAYIDRSVLTILAEPIKRDLGFSDTQLGLLTGFAFAVFYSLAGVPIARYVDRPSTHRPAVIATCMALWSAMCMLSGLIVSYSQLLLARALVAVGEAGAGPAVITLINDHVPRANRARVFAVYGLGLPLGTLLGLTLGGGLVGRVGWRWTFIIVGAPGLLVALGIRLFLHEPRERRSRSAEQPLLRDNVAVILRSPALRWLTAATSLGGIISLGLPIWTGVYLIRVLGLSPAKAGLILGVALGVGGALGTYFGGLIADRLSRHDQGRALLVPCVGLLVGMPAAIGGFLCHDWPAFAVLYFIAIIGASTHVGPLFSLVQLLVGERHRATTIVIVLMLFNLVGAGLGPFLVGTGSDLLRPRFGVESLRWIMIAGQATAVIPAALYLRATALAGPAIASTRRHKSI